MKKFELIVGIDLAKLTLTVCSGTNPEQTKLFTIDNTVEALSGLIEELTSQVSMPSAILVCFEYTGNCGDKLTHLLAGAGIVTWAIHPQVGSSYSTVLSREKNDDIDTLNLWEFAYVHQHKVEPYVLPSESTLKIKELQTARKQYIKKRTATINQIKDLKQKMKPGDVVLDLHVNTLKKYNENIDFLNDEIEKEIKNNPILKRQKQILKSIPGIGEVTSTHLIAISDGFEKFDYNPKKIAAVPLMINNQVLP